MDNKEDKIYEGSDIVAGLGAYCLIINRLFRCAFMLFIIGTIGVLFYSPAYSLFCVAAMGMFSYGYQEKVFSEYCINDTIDLISQTAKDDNSFINYASALTAYGTCLYIGVSQTLMVNNIAATLSKINDHYPEFYDNSEAVMDNRLSGMVKWYRRHYTFIGIAFIICILSSWVLSIYFAIQWNILSIVFFAAFVEMFTKSRYFIGVFLGELVYIDYLYNPKHYGDILDKHVNTFTGGYYEKDNK